MLRGLKILYLIICIALAGSLCGCAQSNDKSKETATISEEAMIQAIQEKNADETVKLINGYSKQDNKDDLDKAVSKEFKSLAESTEHENFTFMDNVIAAIKDEDLKTQLQTTLDENQNNRAKAFLTGQWVRRDCTSLDGAVIEIKWNDETGVALLTNPGRGKKLGFQSGDVKWKSIEVLSQTEVLYEDLSKGDGSADYNQAYATILYDQNMITCKITTENENYYDGNTQLWLKADLIDKDKETLKNNDLLINKEVDIKSLTYKDYYYFFFYFYNAKTEPNDSVVNLRNNLHMKATRDEIIKEYGYGHILYEPNKDDPMYKAFKAETDYADLKLGKQAFKETKYRVVYMDKDNSHFIKMYFNAEDQLIFVVVAGDYYGWVNGKYIE